jgi:hypothetical protein
VRRTSKGLPNIDLARLNLKTGRPLSRLAAEIPDNPLLVQAAWAAAREILGEGEKLP